MKRKIGKLKIRRIVVELDNGTEFVIDPQYGQVQTVTRGHAGFVTGHSMVSMEQFLADGEVILKAMTDAAIPFP